MTGKADDACCWETDSRSVNWCILLVALGFVAVLAGGFLWYAWNTADPARRVLIGQELVKSVLQLGLISVGGGVVGFLLQRYHADKDRKLKNQDAAKQAHEGTLKSQSDLIGRLVTVANTVQRAPSLIEGHRSAKTYGEQMRLAIDSRFELERCCEEGSLLKSEVFKEWLDIQTAINSMIGYLGKLETEFRKEYQGLSELQRQAEKEEPSLKADVWNKIKSLPMIQDMFGPDDKQEADSTQFVKEFLLPYHTAIVKMKKAVGQRQNLIA